MFKIPDGLNRDQLLCVMQHGSHLYGTNTDKSDLDYKGIYIPTREQLALCNVPKSYSSHPKKVGEGVRNEAGDVDIEIYSLHYFLELAMQGQTIAIDMLHAPEGWEDLSTWIWEDLKTSRHLFYTKNLKAFVGYARKQAAKYGIKGSRVAAIKKVLDYLQPLLEGKTDPGKLMHHWVMLPEGEHLHKMTVGDMMSYSRQFYQVCGRQLQNTVTVQHAVSVLEKIYDNYGHRAKLAAENKGIDWKAISHAMRAAEQLRQIYTDNDITFPLQNADYLKLVKYGEIHWDLVQHELELMIAEVETLAQMSNYPENVNRNFWNRWLRNLVIREVME